LKKEETIPGFDNRTKKKKKNAERRNMHQPLKGKVEKIKKNMGLVKQNSKSFRKYVGKRKNLTTRKGSDKKREKS